MGFMSATLSDYIEYEFAFLSKREYLNTKLINEKLELFYSLTRENEEELNFILDKVEELINLFHKDTKLRIGDEIFHKNFVGIVRFLYEASYIGVEFKKEITKQFSESLKKRFVSISEKLLSYCDLIGSDLIGSDLIEL